MSQRPAVRKQMQLALERRRQVGALRLAGYRDQRQIAQQLGVSQKTISRDFAWLDEQYRQSAAADITAEKGRDLERLEALIVALWQNASRGQWLAIDRVIALLERKAKLLGLDAPKLVKVDMEAYLRQVAEEEGLDPAKAIEVAERIIKSGVG